MTEYEQIYEIIDKQAVVLVGHLLKRRHLAPSHGSGTIYIPNKDKDSMLIREVPDIVTTGDGTGLETSTEKLIQYKQILGDFPY